MRPLGPSTLQKKRAREYYMGCLCGSLFLQDICQATALLIRVEFKTIIGYVMYFFLRMLLPPSMMNSIIRASSLFSCTKWAQLGCTAWLQHLALSNNLMAAGFAEQYLNVKIGMRLT